MEYSLVFPTFKVIMDISYQGIMSIPYNIVMDLSNLMWNLKSTNGIYVTVITYLVTILMDKFISVYIPTYFQFVQMPIIETKFCILTIPKMNYCYGWLEMDESSLRNW